MVGVFELYGAGPAERGVAAATVVEPFDVFEDRVRELDSGVPSLPVEQFDLQSTQNHACVIGSR